MTVRVDTQAAKERAEWALENLGAEMMDGISAEHFARDVLALVALLADAEKALHEICGYASQAIPQKNRLPEITAIQVTAKEALHNIRAFDAAGGAGTE